MSKKVNLVILLVSLSANLMLSWFLYDLHLKDSFFVGVDQGKRLTASTGIYTSVVVPPESSSQTGILICSEDFGATCLSLVYSGRQIKNFFLSDSAQNQWYFQFFEGNLDPETIQIQRIQDNKRKSYSLIAEYDQ
jgi:hypothetical protein